MRDKEELDNGPEENRREVHQETTGWSFTERFLRAVDDMGIVLLIALAGICMLGLIGITRGAAIDPIVGGFRRWLGWGAVLMPFLMVLIAAVLYKRRIGHLVAIPWLQVIAIEIMVIGILAFLSILAGMDLVRAEEGFGGGIVGWGISTLLGDIFGSVGRVIVLLLVILITGGIGLSGYLRAGLTGKASEPAGGTPASAGAARMASPAVRAAEGGGRGSAPPREIRRVPREFRKNFKITGQADEKPQRPIRRDHRLPPLELLEEGEVSRITSKEINQSAGLIEKTLADFGLPARVVNFRTGPSVTQFAVEPGYVETVSPEGEVKRQKVRVSQISGLANDLALSLSAPRLRIEAPVPGQSYVGIEVPNKVSSAVRLRPILESNAFQKFQSPLAIALGRDVAGAAVAADLISMPHLLIAGTTGSGKSVCITSIATCLGINNTPDDLRLVMVDPKMVELIRFNGLPHLLGKVETELERIIGVLRWCTAEMDRRYRLLEDAKARDIDAYNKRLRGRKSQERLPRIVILIDELADLMMMAPDQTEHTLVRLAQMARATGIHLVVATQRPSTDILTGLIKANFPARISFAVASSVDSRVILDSAGAETLLGRGDMLYVSPEASAPARLQGAYVSDQELERIIEYWRSEMDQDQIEEEAPWEDLLRRQIALDDRDDILEQAIEIVRARGEASASMLQRALRVGYPRAARLMDELEELGVIGRAQSGGRTREVLLSDDDDPFDEVSPDPEESSS